MTASTSLVDFVNNSSLQMLPLNIPLDVNNNNFEFTIVSKDHSFEVGVASKQVHLKGRERERSHSLTPFKWEIIINFGE